MWHVIAEEDIYCTECRHKIPSGTACLSQMPLAMPDNFSRRKFQNFCIECVDCGVGLPPCFVRWLNYHALTKTVRSVSCGYCDEAIPEGARAVVQHFYAWPDSKTTLGPQNGAIHYDSAPSAPSWIAFGAAARPRPAEWHTLGYSTQRQFLSRGLGRGLGARSQAMGERLYQRLVPEAIRNLGEPLVRDFIREEHFSHIKSVANVPGRAKAPSNIILEHPATNLARGSRNMTAAAHAAARSASRASAVRIATGEIIKRGAKAGLIATAAEAAVAIPENILHYRRGRKTRQQASKDAVKSAAAAAVVSVATAGVAQGATVAGIGLSLGPFGTPLIITGGVVVTGSAIYRITKAAKRDMPLDEYRIFFCRNVRCESGFAWEVTMAARETPIETANCDRVGE